MALLPPSAFEAVFSPLRGKKIAFVELSGNVGDRLINAATCQLFRCFGIEYIKLGKKSLEQGVIDKDIEEIVIAGGGNMGSYYPLCLEARKKALSFRLPVTVLPQSFISTDEDISVYKKVYARELSSLEIDSSLELAPDMALGYADHNNLMPPEFELGVFLREDSERVVLDSSSSLGDPITFNHDPDQYIAFASRFAHIYTDRLHFAIAGLIAGRKVTLLPNTYFKNRAMLDTWLADLGCNWRNNLEGIEYDKSAIIELLWSRLAGVPGWGPCWASVPDRESGDQWHVESQRQILNDKDGNKRLAGDEQAQLVWSLCDGKRSVDNIAEMIGDAYPQQRVAIGRDVRHTINQLSNTGAITLNRDDSTHRMSIRLSLLDDFSRDGWFYRQARIVYPDAPEKRLWFAVPDEHAGWLDTRIDTFAIAILMDAMFRRRPLEVLGGGISSSLSNHLQVFQEVWDTWRSDYEAVHLEVNSITETELTESKPSLLAFSGGLDSAYSAWRLSGEKTGNPFSALMVHGLDIPLTDQKGFNGAFSRAQRILDPLEIKLIAMRTNFRAVHGDEHWEYRHATALAGALTLFSGKFGMGIVSATLPASMQSFWGSNPSTDPLLGSSQFPINHYGDDATRLEKIRHLEQFPEILENLRVCWKGFERDRNCGHCGKCLMMRLSLIVLELDQCCFDEAMSAEEVSSKMSGGSMGRMEHNDLKEILVEARKRFPNKLWFKKMEKRYAYLFNIKSW